MQTTTATEETGLDERTRTAVAASAALRATVKQAHDEAAERGARLRRRAGLAMRRAEAFIAEAREADETAQALGRWLAVDDAARKGR